MIAELVRIDSSISEYQNTSCTFYSQTGAAGDQWFDLTDNTGKMIVSVNPGNNNLGTIYLNAKHFGVGTANIPRFPFNNNRIMPRYLRLYCSNYSGNFPSPVKVRLYFRNSELEDYKTITNQPLLTRDQMKITHYSGQGEDCDLQNNSGKPVMVEPDLVKEFTTEGYYIEVTVNHFSEFGSIGGTQTLPVTLTQFNALSKGDIIELKWNTTQELNNKGFEILRSKDGTNFVKIGWLDGHGTTQQAQQYSFTDLQPFAGRNYYRLRQTDIDNNSSLSNIVAASTTKSIKLQLSPNPVENVLYIECDVQQTECLRILDIQGRVLWKSDGVRLSPITAVPVQQLNKAVYLLEATDKQGNRQTQRFIKN